MPWYTVSVGDGEVHGVVAQEPTSQEASSLREVNRAAKTLLLANQKIKTKERERKDKARKRGGGGGAVGREREREREDVERALPVVIVIVIVIASEQPVGCPLFLCFSFVYFFPFFLFCRLDLPAPPYLEIILYTVLTHVMKRFDLS